MFPRTWIIAVVVGMLATQTASAGTPTRILLNGSILTMDATDRVAEALAIEDDKIVFVGSSADARKLAARETSIVDLGGRTVIPGLNDTHIHAIRGGQSYNLETYLYDVTSLADALDPMKDAAARQGAGK